MLVIIELIGAIGIVLLMAYRFTGTKQYAVWGQSCLIASFGLIAFALIRGGSFWIGAAFAFAALVQASAIIRNKLRRKRENGTA